MEIIKREKVKFIRVLIGDCETGNSGLKNSRTINILDASVDEVYNLIKKSIEKEMNKK